MKRTKTANNLKNRSPKSPQPSMTCSCQILNDTQLSNVGDSDCDCSECLEAHLQAFNQLKQQQRHTNYSNNQINQTQSSKNNHFVNKDKSKYKDGTKIEYKNEINRHRSVDPNSKTRKKYEKKSKNEQQNEEFEKFEQGKQFTNGQINDFLLITQYRTRKYLQQRRKLQNQQKLQRDILKQKIKKNLKILEYTSQQLRKNNENKETSHPYKWNHSKYKCQCNGKAHKHKCCSKTKVKQKLDTNLQKFKQNFAYNRDQILQQKKKMRQQLRKKQELAKCPHDLCQNHHNKTNQNKLKQIELFILKNVKKHQKQKKKQKQKQLQSKNVKQGKLRAIDIKSRQILSRSKKYDNDITKTSFRLSIDQYDTFSQLRQQNLRRKKAKQEQLKVKKAIKEGGGELQNKIYQFQQQQQYQIDENMGQNIIKQKKTLQRAPQVRNQNQIFDRIAYDAHLKVPQQLNKKLTQTKKVQHKHSPRQKQQKRQKNLSKGKQQEAKRKIEEQISKKKKQIMNQYQKRNNNKPLNHDVRKQYEQKLTKNKDKTSKKKLIETQKDYIIQQLGDINKGKDLLKGKKGPKGQSMNIYNQNFHHLSSKRNQVYQ